MKQNVGANAETTHRPSGACIKNSFFNTAGCFFCVFGLVLSGSSGLPGLGVGVVAVH
jgi:hypothetical protein